SVTIYLFKRALVQLLYIIFWMIVGFVLVPAAISLINSNPLDLKGLLRNTHVGQMLFFLISLLALFGYRDFKLLNQNGISRKTYWKARLLAYFGISTLGQIVGILFTLLVPFQDSWNRSSIYMEMYGKFFANPLLNILAALAFIILAAYVVALGGIFVGSIFTLFTRKQRVLIFVALATLNVVGVSFIASSASQDSFTGLARSILKLIYFLVGDASRNATLGSFDPTVPFIVFLLAGIVFCYGSRIVIAHFKLKSE
ncbi:MAG: ABC transporter permease, partial [Liquorilactobacillus satsumensis]